MTESHRSLSLARRSGTKTFRISGYSRQIGLYRGERIATPACALARNDTEEKTLAKIFDCLFKPIVILFFAAIYFFAALKP